MTWFTKLSANVKSAIVLALVLLVGVIAAKYALSKAEQRGRAGALSDAAVTMAGYVAVVNPLLAKKDSIVVRVDTLRLRAEKSAAAAITAIAAVPQAVRDAEPTVDLALTKCEEMAADFKQLNTAQMTERTAWRDIRSTDSTMIVSQALVIVAKNDTIAVLQKRPRWRTVIKVATTTATIGIAVGRYVFQPKRN